MCGECIYVWCVTKTSMMMMMHQFSAHTTFQASLNMHWKWRAIWIPRSRHRATIANFMRIEREAPLPHRHDPGGDEYGCDMSGAKPNLLWSITRRTYPDASSELYVFGLWIDIWMGTMAERWSKLLLRIAATDRSVNAIGSNGWGYVLKWGRCRLGYLEIGWLFGAIETIDIEYLLLQETHKALHF